MFEQTIRSKFSFNPPNEKKGQTDLKDQKDLKDLKDQLEQQADHLQHVLAAARPLIYGRDKYATEFSPPPSPTIERRTLAPETESVLQAACTALVSKYHIPSQATEQPTLNFEMLYRSMEDKKTEDPQQPSQTTKERSNAAALPYLHPIDTGVSAKLTAFKTTTVVEAVPKESDSSRAAARANLARRRDSSQAAPPAINHGLARGTSTSKHSKRQSAERPNTAMNPSLGNSGRTACSTPMTGSSERQYNPQSTAPTSVAALSPLDYPSKRGSNQLPPDPTAVAPWLRGVSESTVTATAEGLKAPKKTLSKKKSIREGIRDYIRPGSSGLSRKESQESLRSASSSSQPVRPGSSSGWRSWGLQRRPSKNSVNSRPGTAAGQQNNPPSVEKPPVNLNRDLPPLPSLDSWKDNIQQEESPTPAHIASLIRSDNNDPTRRESRRDPKSDIRAKSLKPRPNQDNRFLQRTSSIDAERKKGHRRSLTSPESGALKALSISVRACVEPTIQETIIPGKTKQPFRIPSLDLDNFMMRSGSKIERSQSTEPTAANQSRRQQTHRKDDVASQAAPAPTGRMSIDNQRRTASAHHKSLSIDRGDATNFSRKISVEVSRDRGSDPRGSGGGSSSTGNRSTPDCRHPEAKSEQRKGLRRILSAFGTIKKKKSAYLVDAVDRNRTKNGSPYSDEFAAGAPVVRY